MNVQKTEDFAVKFGRDPSLGLEEQKAFPFIYTLVNHSDDLWQPDLAQGVLSLTNLSSIGPVVPAGGYKQVNVLLDADYNYKLLSIKYTAYCLMPANGASYYFWHVVPQKNMLISDGMADGVDWPGEFIWKYLGVTLSFQGSGSKILYGGPDCGVLGGNRVPLPLNVIQGHEYGFLTTRTPYLLPRQGIMAFEFTNNFSMDIVVGAAIYGMKIRV
jgi:hypothetical protein